MTALDDRPTTTTDWWNHAACQGMDLAIFFPHSGEHTKIRDAKTICADCPVWPECRQDAIDAGDTRSGIWGGTTETDRRKLRRPPATQPGRTHGGPRARTSSAVRAAAVARFHELRPAYATDTRCAATVGAEHGVSATAVVDWVRAARKTQQAALDTAAG